MRLRYIDYLTGKAKLRIQYLELHNKHLARRIRDQRIQLRRLNKNTSIIKGLREELRDKSRADDNGMAQKVT